MKQTKIEVSATILLEYDEESVEFNQAYDNYITGIEDGATVSDMLRHVAWHIASFGAGSHIECLGYVSIDGNKQGDVENWCGINVNGDVTINGNPEFTTYEI